MSDAPPTFNKPSPIERAFSKLFGWLVGVGIGLPHNYLLLVAGRKTGRTYTTPVDVLSFRGKRFLVAGRGHTQWVRNAIVSGKVTLKKGSERLEFDLRVVPDSEKPDILKAYLDRFKRTVQRYFPVQAGAPASAFVALASRYPVFELMPSKGPATSGV